MSTVKITALTATTDPASSDILPIVSDPSGSAATKKVTIENLMKNAAAGSASLPGVAFDGDPDSGVARVGANNVAICTNGTNRLDVGAAGVVDIKLGGSASTPALIFEGDVNTGISHSADTLIFSTAGSSRLTLTSNGNVGIGTSPQYRTQVFGGSDSQENVLFTVQSNGVSNSGNLKTTLRLANSTSTSSVHAADISAIRTTNAEALAFSLYNGGSAPVERMNIDNLGNVRIASEHLRFNTTGKGIIFGIEGGSNRPSIVGNYTNDANNNIVFNVTGSPRFTLTSTGSAEFKGSVLADNIDVSSSSGKNGWKLSGSSSTDLTGKLELQCKTGAASSTKVFEVFNGNTSTSSIAKDGSASFAGNVGIGNTSARGLLHVGPDLANGATDAARINLKQNGLAATDGIYLERSGERRGYHMFIGAPNDGLTFRANNNGTFTTAMYLNRDGNVGIGTDNPAGALHVDAASGVDGPVFDSGGTANANHALLVRDSANSQLFRVNNNGNVGIGTSSPLVPFVVSDGEVRNIEMGYSSSLTNNYIQSYNRSTSAYMGLTIAANPISLQIGASEAMQIDSSGRLLVGTTTYSSTRPSGAIHLDSILTTPGFGNISLGFNGTAAGNQNVFTFYRTRGTSAGSVDIVQSGDSLGSINFNGADGVDALSAAASIKAEVDGTPGSNDMPGRLIFATTADGENSPTPRMRIGSGGEVSITAFDNSTTNVALSLKHLNGTGKVQLDWGGNVRAVNTSGIQAIVSERRLKNNIQPIDTNQSWINARDIPWRIFEYLDNPGAKYTGHIVDEVEAIDPTLILNTGQSDDEGPIRTYDNPLLNAMRFNALQEALKRIETLEQRLSDAGIA